MKRIVFLLALFMGIASANAQRYVKTVDTLAEMVIQNPKTVYTNVFVAEPIRGGNFTLAHDVIATNIGTKFASTTTGWSWKRVYSGPVNVRWFGAKGDQVTDDTAAFTNAIAFGTNVYVPSGIYKVAGPIDFDQNTQIIGDGKSFTTITNSNSDFTFQFISALGAIPYEYYSSIRFSDFTLKAKNGFQINYAHDWTTYFNLQAAILNPVFERLTFEGKYAAVLDADYCTTNMPTLGSLTNWGVGISAAKMCYGVIRDSQFTGYGVGIHLLGSDLNKIQNCLMWGGARNIHISGIYTWGAMTSIENCEFLSLRRVGGIYIDSVSNTQIKHNYFETYEPSAMFLYTMGDWGTMFMENRLDNTGQLLTPAFYFQPVTGLRVHHNIRIPSANLCTAVVTTNYWTFNQPVLGYWYHNDLFFPIPDCPSLEFSEHKEMICGVNNLEGVFGPGSINMPFVKDPIAGRWAFNGRAGGFIFAQSHSGISSPDYKITFTGRPIDVTDTYAIVAYNKLLLPITNLFAGWLGFDGVNTNVTQTRSFYFTMPTNYYYGGYFTVNLTDRLNLEQFKIEPVYGARPGLTITNYFYTLDVSTNMITNYFIFKDGLFMSNWHNP